MQFDPASSIKRDIDDKREKRLKMYKPKIDKLKELFPNTDDLDIAMALEKNDGSLDDTVQLLSKGLHAIVIFPVV